MPSKYADRAEAGRALATELTDYAGRDDVVVIGLPRGGVPVAAEVATSLAAPLDVVVVRKLGLPQQPELAMGAITAVGETVTVVRNDGLLERAGVSEEEFDGVLAVETAELRRREALYRGANPPVPVTGTVAIVVDDGLATGSTMRAAVKAVRSLGPERIVVAVPTGPASACRELGTMVDEMVCATNPEPFNAVGLSYREFAQTTDEEVRELLDASADD